MTIDERIRARAEQAVRDKIFPGCEVGYIRDGQTQILGAGKFRYETDAPDIRPDTVYDVASITKSIPTTSLALKLIEEGRLSPNDQVITYLPELQNDQREQVLIWHLMTYTVLFSTPPSFAKMAYAHPENLIEHVLTAPLREPVGTRYQYTSPPALLLGLIVERIYGGRLDGIAKREFFEPLGMTQSTFEPEKIPKEQVVPTEINDRGEVWGEPHDEATWVLKQRGKVPGHAGMFSTAGDLLKFAQMLLNDGELDGRRYFKPETIKLMHTNQAAELGAMVGLGWMLEPPLLVGIGGDQKFGMTGFTGCIVLMDPVSRRAMVHLSNRTYPDRPTDKEDINGFRRDIARIIFEG